MSFNALDRYLDSFYIEKNIPGLACVIYRHGQLIHTHCAGYANVEQKRPFTEDTLLNLYSATKVSTCTAGMRLVERGLLPLDAPVADFLPEYAEVLVQTEDGGAVPAKNVMLVRHLFSMSAGLSYDADAPALRRLKETAAAPTTREVARALAQQPLLFEPGAHYRYSFCHDVLGAVLEVVEGLSLSDVLRREVFEPLGMENTAFRLTESQRACLAPEYHHFDAARGAAEAVVMREGVDMGMGPRYESGGGGLISCARDYGILASTLANGGLAPNGVQLLKRETVDLMRTNQLSEAALPDYAAMGGWSKSGYGYGLGVRTLMNRERNHSLSENGEFGWDGALGCYLLADPAQGIGLFYAQHEAGSPWYNWHGMIRNMAYVGAL